MKKSFFFISLQVLFGVIAVQAQQVKSMLTVDGKSRTEINMAIPL